MRASRGLSFTSAIAVGLGAVLLLGACTPEETETTPTASPTVEEPTPTPTPTTPPEAIAPERPAEMAEISVAGAEAAATYFLQLYPYVYATGDLTEWRSLSDPGCDFCAAVVENVEAQFAAGNVNRGSLMEISNLAAIDITPTRYGVNALVTEGPSQEVDSTGKVVSEIANPATYETVFALLGSESGWLVLEVDFTEVAP